VEQEGQLKKKRKKEGTRKGNEGRRNYKSNKKQKMK